MILYMETSGLVKVYVEESGSENVRNLILQADLVATSVISYAEARAAFARKFRDKEIKEKDHDHIKRALESDWDRFFIVDLTSAVVKDAGNLAEKYALRGFDALHLASALMLKRTPSSAVAFSSADKKLREAATREGLHIAD